MLFHDGRLSVSDLYGTGFDSPAEEYLPAGLDGLIAAQALFPLVSMAEMAGQPGENEIAQAATERLDKAWPLLAARVSGIPAYAEMFADAFDDVRRPGEITITHVANALAAFIGTEWRSFDSPFDAWARDGTPLPPEAEAGRRLFYGEAGCSGCHSGPLLTDQRFHAAGLPQFGPGRTRRFDPMARDVGRMGSSDRLEDAYRFRTPSLRNVALTAPYGHNGAYPTLEGIIRHMADPRAARAAWTPDMAALPEVPWLAAGDFTVAADRFESARQARALDIEPRPLDDPEVARIAAFLQGLTGASATGPRPLGRPETVPSGLPVD